MNPSQNDQQLPATQAKKEEPVKDDAYAQSLLQALDAQMKLEQLNTPKTHYISTKKKVYIIGFVIVTIVSLLLTPVLFKSDKTPDSKATTQQLLNSTDYTRNLEK